MYRKSNCFLSATHKNGEWDPSYSIHRDPYLPLHITSNALHYGQAIFEGLKAFHCKDGSVRVFADHENLLRLNKGATRMHMPTIDQKQWTTTLDDAIKLNAEWIPPYGTNGSLYIRCVRQLLVAKC